MKLLMVTAITAIGLTTAPNVAVGTAQPAPAPPAETSQLVPAPQGSEPQNIQPFNSPGSSDPNDLPVVGGPGSGGLFWKDMEIDLGSKYCNDSKTRCSDWVDLIKARVTVNPGAWSNKITWQLLYDPNNSWYSGIHLQFYAINHGVITSLPDQNSNAQGSGPGEFILYNNTDLHDDVLTVAVKVWAKDGDGNWVSSGAKTADATCDPPYVNGEESNVCRY